MCGICGKLNFDREENVSQSLLTAMADSIAHRGPDDDGYFISGQIGLGFRLVRGRANYGQIKGSDWRLLRR